MAGACDTYGGRGRVGGSLVGKHELKKTLVRPQRRLGDNIKIDHKEMQWE